MPKMLQNRVAAVVAGSVLLVTVGGVGGAVAGGLVTSAQIQDQTIRSVDIATGGVGSSEIRPGAIGPRALSQATTDKFKSAAVSGYEVNTYDYIAGKQDTPTEPGMGPDYGGVGGGAIATVACSPGKEALGGGYWFRSESAMTDGLAVVQSMPGRMDWTTNTPKPARNDGWIVRVNQPQNVAPGDLTMYAICANVA